VEERGVALSQKKWLRQKRTILFVDEAGFYLLPHIVRTWARRGCRPILRESGRRRKDHLSAVAGVTLGGKLYMFSQPEAFDSGAVIEFLKQLMWCIKGKIGIIWDGASIHRSEEIKEFLRQVGRGRIELVRLPAYAPELNPVEGVWSLLKGFYLRNFACHDLAQLKNLLSGAASALSSKPERVKACFGQAGY
jgi:transposase